MPAMAGSLLLCSDLTGREHRGLRGNTEGCGLNFNSVNAALMRKPFFLYIAAKAPSYRPNPVMRRGSGMCLDMGLGAEAALLDALACFF